MGHGDRWSLEPTRGLLAEIGNPDHHYPIIHIGGTNGKGSVAVMVAQALRATGRAVGVYTSPHLVDVTERVVVNETPVSQDAFATWTTRLRPAIERADASFFEASTVIALAHFAASGVDVAVVEVGLGGRLDSTNVVSPVISVVTSIGIDHAEYLGGTLAEIAGEKAAIAKPGVPFVVGESDRAIGRVLYDRAAELGAEAILVPSEDRYAGPLRLAGSHQQRNAAVARAVLEGLPPDLCVSEEAMTIGFARAWLPGRYERRGRWILDVAHNTSAVAVLAETIRASNPARPVHVLLGVLRDKALMAMAETLTRVADRVWLTLPPTAPVHRALSEPPAGLPPGVVFEPDFERALRSFQIGAETLVVTGSFHTVGDVMTRLPGFQPFG